MTQQLFNLLNRTAVLNGGGAHGPAEGMRSYLDGKLVRDTFPNAAYIRLQRFAGQADIRSTAGDKQVISTAMLAT